MSEGRQERKVVTVLFCDLVGFTRQAEDMDPEDVASMLVPYHARLKEELERYGGTVEKFIGDAVMAVFGAPVAHEDDPERAVRAALAIREFAQETEIELRIGIATGEALVTLGARPDQGETMASGDVVNTAARLQAAAPVNGILVGEKTHEATTGSIEFEQVEPITAKGKSRPVPVWVALRARSRITLDRLHTSPLVGRARELDLLEDALGRARAEHQPQLVTLVGVPGIGKSRLVYELSEVVDRDPELISWRQGRCLPYGDGVTFWALGEIVKGQLGILDTDTAEQAELKLREAVTDEWIRTHLRPLVGLGADTGEGDRREEAFTAWRRFLEDIAAQRPLTLVFEDLHWADESLLDFVDHLVDWASGVRLLVVCTARPELLERRPGWGGGKTNALTISLSPLSDEETTRLVSTLIQRAVLPADTHGVLLARAGGNPLYAEHYARLLEDRAVGDELALPETVQGLIAARLDLLDPGEKALLQDAAVVGKVFWLGALASVSGIAERPAEVGLHALARKGFVRRDRETTIAGDTEYAFLHVLVRDVAYGQLPRVPRSEKHRLAAHWLEALGRPEDHAEMVAYHYREALTLGRAAGLDTTPFEDSARRALGEAGDRALALNAYEAALRFYEEALELTPEDGPERARLLLGRAKAYFLGVDEARTDLFGDARDAFLAVGDREAAADAQVSETIALRSSGRTREAVDGAESAAALLADAPLGATKATVVANWARNLVLAGNYEDALTIGREALEMGSELGLGELQAHALNTIGMARVSMGDFGGLADLDESLRLILEHGSPFEIGRVSNNLGFALYTAGRVERASELIAAALENAERFGLEGRWPRAGVLQDDFWRGRWDEAERRADEWLEDDSPNINEPSVRAVRARIRLGRDDVGGATADCAAALEALGDEWDVGENDLVSAVCACAEVALADGRQDEAADLADKLVALGGAAPQNAATAPIELALLLEALGRPGSPIIEACDEFPQIAWLQAAVAVVRGEHVSAADRLAELRTPPLEAAVRLRAAEHLVGGGRRAEADVQLQKALGFYRSVGATRYIREGEALLAATA
jgi:class 3 adenylate cyclase/tetratricopeptide (TPR) repeat protein